MKKGIFVFDYDGTLFDTMTADAAAFEQTLMHFGLPPMSVQTMTSLIGLTDKDIASECLGRASQDQINEFSRFFTQVEVAATYETGRLYAGVPELLEILRAKGFEMEICSNGNQAYLEANRIKFGLDRYFNRIHTADNGKSKIQMLAEINQYYRADYGVMIGDRSIDISAGKANGFITIGVQYGFGGDEVLAADYIASQPSDLNKILIDISRS